MEVHPLEISFCEDCGDFFARIDSLQRHCRSQGPPAECVSVTLEKADEKCRETQKAHNEFMARLEGFLENRSGGCRDAVFADYQGEVFRFLEEAQGVELVQWTLINPILYAHHIPSVLLFDAKSSRWGAIDGLPI
jgi:hypothetical protein